MRKHQEGYVLVYVMVAVVLLSLLGAVSCEIAVSNLKAQQSTIDRMKDEYAAEGVIEAFCAELIAGDYGGGDTKYSWPDGVQNNFYEELTSKCPAPPGSSWPVKGEVEWSEPTQAGEGSSAYESTATLKLKLEDVQHETKVETEIEATVVLNLTRYIKYKYVTDSNMDETKQELDGYEYTYTVTVDKLEYKSFTHTTVERNGQSPSGGETNQTGEAQKTETQVSDAKICVAQGADDQPSCEGSGSIYLKVGESYTVPVTFSEEIGSQARAQMRSTLKSNLNVADTSIATCESLKVTGVSVGNTTLNSPQYGISIPVYVTE